MRGQIPQLFIFLMALLVIGSTIFLSTKLIGGLTSTSCDASKADFLNSIKQTLDENSAYGSRNRVSVPLPCDAVALCFVDYRSLGENNFQGSNPTINASVKNNVKTNIFLELRDGIDDAGYDQRIILTNPSDEPEHEDLCISAIGGKFTFSTDGHGRFIEIAP